MINDFTGQWWFASQTPLDLDPVPAEVNETDLDDEAEDAVDYADDDTPLPPPAGHDKPVCKSCGDPNYSLESEFCIACRIGMPSSIIKQSTVDETA